MQWKPLWKQTCTPPAPLCQPSSWHPMWAAQTGISLLGATAGLWPQRLGNRDSCRYHDSPAPSGDKAEPSTAEQRLNVNFPDLRGTSRNFLFVNLGLIFPRPRHQRECKDVMGMFPPVFFCLLVCQRDITKHISWNWMEKTPLKTRNRLLGFGFVLQENWSY